MLDLKCLAECKDTHARACEFNLNGKTIQTPVFMPVGTKGAVKTLDMGDVEALGYDLILANTYHVYLRPGADIVEELGGVHKFTGFSGRFLTDSGGFQVFSLKDLRKIDAKGVDFRSVIDGSKHRFTPAGVVQIQRKIGADIMMAFDECPPHDESRAYVKKSMQMTHRWAKECIDEFEKDRGHQHLFGIIQGGLHEDLRLESQKEIQSMSFDGIAVGGLSVGETKEDMDRILKALAPGYDPSRPRYLMGVGTPQDFIMAVENGIDMFDCVMPTRVARHARVYTSKGQLNLMNSKFKLMKEPVDPECGCPVCKKYSAAYLHHMFKAKEMTGQRLATLHNLSFFKKFLAEMRESILDNRFVDFKEHWLGKLEK
jgi:queuine tRNA-ribosyltransferase